VWKLLVDKRDGKGSDVIPPLKLWNLLSGARDTSRYTCLLIQIKYTCVCNYIYIHSHPAANKIWIFRAYTDWLMIFGISISTSGCK
jgi:hypothetical protein